jgi:hypothetical protein
MSLNKPVVTGNKQQTFSEWFSFWTGIYGADKMWIFLVDSGDMEPWEFRFWAGFASLT